MRITQGSERLGSGGKLSVDLDRYQRSTFDLSFSWRSSMAAGTLVPFMVEVSTPGTTWDIDIESKIMTHPTLGPLLGSYKAQYDIFECPVRLYHSALMQNRRGIGMSMQNVLLPQIESDVITASTPPTIYSNPDNVQINPSALLAYLGVRGWGTNVISQSGGGSPKRQKSALELLMYWDIFYNYYANKQETDAWFITPQTATANTITTVAVDGNLIPKDSYISPGATVYGGSAFVITFAGTAPLLTQITFTTDIGQIKASDFGTWTSTGTTHTLNAGSFTPGVKIQQYGYTPSAEAIQLSSFPLQNIVDTKQAIMATSPTGRLTFDKTTFDPYATCVDLAKTPKSQCGLAVKTYQSDMLNNWVNVDNYTIVTNTSTVSTGGGSFTIDALASAKKVWEYLARIAVTDGSYTAWIKGAYDQTPFEVLMMPIYHGGLSKELIFTEVISTAGQGDDPLGTLGGKGQMANKHKGGKIRIKSNEMSYIIGIVSLTPRLDVSQGNKWHTDIANMRDYHVPGMDGLGMQNLPTEYMAWWDTQWSNIASQWTIRSAGKQTAWIQYQTNLNRTYGNFAIPNNEMFMTLNRRYEMDATTGRIKDLTTYIDPAKHNFVFAYTNLDSQNFWTQIVCNIHCRRKMSSRIMPRL